jgi:tetratricopeptide (TPR) repeat protein
VTLAGQPNGSGPTPRKPALEAYTLFLKGRHFWNQVSQAGIQAALHEFTRAITLYPDYAPPYAALAEAYSKITFWSVIPPGVGIARARQAALEAIRLDPTTADAYAFLGVIVTTYDWQWDEGARLFQRALELQPSNMNALSMNALQHVFRGEFQAAQRYIEKSSELDPISPWSFRNQAWYYYFKREYGQAIDAMRSALALDPNFREGQFMLAYAYLRQDRFTEAIAQLIGLPDGPYDATKWGALGEAYACAGSIAAAEDALSRLDALARTGYVSPYNRACIYAGLRQWERVFEQLELAYLEHTPWLSAIKVDPRYDPIREDPRLAGLLTRLNLS